MYFDLRYPVFKTHKNTPKENPSGCFYQILKIYFKIPLRNLGLLKTTTFKLIASCNIICAKRRKGAFIF